MHFCTRGATAHITEADDRGMHVCVHAYRNKSINHAYRHANGRVGAHPHAGERSSAALVGVHLSFGLSSQKGGGVLEGTWARHLGQLLEGRGGRPFDDTGGVQLLGATLKLSHNLCTGTQIE